jgi:hypothetical protein
VKIFFAFFFLLSNTAFSWEEDPRIESHLKATQSLLIKASRDPRAKEVVKQEALIYSQKIEDGLYVIEKDLPDVRGIK